MRTCGRDLSRGVLWQADELEKFAKPIMNKPKPKPKKEEKKEEEKKEGEGADGEAPAEAEAEAEAEGAHDLGRPDSCFGLCAHEVGSVFAAEAPAEGAEAPADGAVPMDADLD